MCNPGIRILWWEGGLAGSKGIREGGVPGTACRQAMGTCMGKVGNRGNGSEGKEGYVTKGSTRNRYCRHGEMVVVCGPRHRRHTITWEKYRQW